ncbi:nitroreductase family protein [Heyndrickxia ginsengihumi]|uniref:nitroreductase family protein n=1 Tax=Heyndrickxia ginsengihumi TaxID=363870 RepID=UPI000472AD80|nr:nitroreductase family protein [Heyndrickxia ginsengihumi]
MNVKETIRQRREITHYLEKPISEEELQQLLNAGYLSPTGNNLPPREFVLITNRAMLEHLALSTPFVPWLAEAQAAIVITGRPSVSKYWLQDASIACGFVWLQATDLGIGCAFGAIYNAEDQAEAEKREDYVRVALHIPDDRRIVAILGFGYPAEMPPAKKQIQKESSIHVEKFEEKE